MLSIKLIRENPELVVENIKKKFQDDKIPLVDEVKSLDEEWRNISKQVDDLRSSRNKLSQEVNKLKKAGEDASEVLAKVKNIPKEIAELEDKKSNLSKRIKEIMYVIPNIIHESVPLGKDDEENVELEKIGEPVVPEYEILHHAELAEKLDCVDFESARETSGHGFYYLEGELAMLHSAMLTFARDFMVRRGFKYVIPPFMIRQNVVEGVMSFAEMDAMMYKIQDEDLFLIGTSEHSMIGRYINTTVNEKELPISLTSYSPCFRKEVGAHGLEEKGLYRVHQFEKQEMVVLCKPEESYEWYDKMLNLTVEFFRELQIPVRKLECCSGDLADLKAKSADVEAWSPRQQKYFEVGSCSNLTDAQARRLNIKSSNGKDKELVHTLNNTVIASPRGLIALIENNQNEDGSINIPKCLEPYMAGITKIAPKN